MPADPQPPAAEPGPDRRVYTTSDLHAEGMSWRGIRDAVAAGALVRVHRGVYVLAGTSDGAACAADLGGRLTCVSVLRERGVFVIDGAALHVHFEHGSTPRRRDPGDAPVVRHWDAVPTPMHPRALQVGIVDALVHATNCQAARAAVASLDSALHQDLITADDLDGIFARVRASRRALRRFVDRRAESGPESIVRLMALMLGFTVAPQVVFRGVGRVDLLLDGWLVVECDSREFHEGWRTQCRDRRRDLALAARGMTTLRPVAADILYHPQLVEDALRGLRDAHRAHTEA